MLDFTPDDHTLTIIFTDVNGNVGSSQYNFTGMERQREPACMAIHQNYRADYFFFQQLCP